MKYVSEAKLELYPAQEEAILELLGGKHVVLATPTGSGKSMVALFAHFLTAARGGTTVYTCPIKALVNEKFFALCDAFGAENVGMMTGDAAINPEAKVLCCTAEILAQRCLRDDRVLADSVVMDEFHYYGDKDRGVAWQVPLLLMPETQMLLMSATLGDVSAITESLERSSGRKVVEVRSASRPVPLEFSYAETPLHETVQDHLQLSKSPIYLVNFSQRAAAEQAQNLMSIDVCSKDEKERLKSELTGVRFDTTFGKELARFLRHGIGLHHAGLLPRYRRLVERLAQQGLLKVVSGTDTLGVGVNVPIRTVLFTQLCKFDGEKTAVLSARDFQQISGRAGRKGFDDKGFVVAQAPEHVIENARLKLKKDAGKKVVMQAPPAKGYAHWDKATFEKLQTRAPEPLESRFAVTHGLLLSLLQSATETRGGGYRKLVGLVGKSHSTPVQKLRHLKHAATLFRSLLAVGVVFVEKRTPTMPAHVGVAPGLQKEFSLHQTLSLYLVETLPQLDPTSDLYALDVLSLVESSLESPEVVLYAQLNRLKGEKIAELKAQGMEYDQRMEELEKLEWPKPNRDFIYGTFDQFAARHPWVGHENIRPKSIAREMFETGQSFNEFIREYGLGRAEGVVLRYLMDAYKTLVQNVPVASKDERVEEIVLYLEGLVRTTDRSLLDEWEQLRAGGPVLPQREAAPPPEFDLGSHEKKLAARIRAEFHHLLRPVARKNWDDVRGLIQNGDDWNNARFEAELAPFFAEHHGIDTTPLARKNHLTQVVADGERRWVARQTLRSVSDAEEPTDWVLEALVELPTRGDPDGPILKLQRIGT